MLQIGNVKLDLPVVQAALSGYSDWPMRAIARQLGAPYTICEVMINSFVTSLKDRQRTRHFLMLTDADHPAGAQLMGADPDEFPQAARRLVNAGFDVIDINFGCPVKKVLGRCRGGFHLSQPPVALEIIRRVRDAVPDNVPVTVKMRRGIDETPQSRDQFFEILAGAVDAGLDAVTIHGRTVVQRYVGPSNWNFLREVRQTFPQLTVLGSGDLFTAEDCVRMLRETGVHGVTAARGAIGNPWIFQQARELLAGRPPLPAPTVLQQRSVIEEHYRLADQVYTKNKAVKQLRKFGMRYALWHPQSDAVRSAFIGVKSPEMWESVLEKWYWSDSPGRYPDIPEAPERPIPQAS